MEPIIQKLLDSVRRYITVPWIGLLIILGLLGASPLIPILMDVSNEGDDIEYYWRRGGQIREGKNPYKCAETNICESRKNPGHFPLFYWASSISQKLGFMEFDDWLSFWHPIFIAFAVGIALLLFYALATYDVFLAYFASLFWLLNRWTLYVVQIAQIDFIALFFAVASVMSIKRNIWLSLFLFSISLATKQMGVFLIPLFLIAVWQHFEIKKLTKTAIGLLVIISIPLITIFPFLIDSPKGVAIGLLFSATRSATDNLGAQSVDVLLEIGNLPSTAFMLSLMALVYLFAWTKKTPLAFSVLLIFMTFLSFNTVLFNQYFIWIMPFVPLAAIHYAGIAKPKEVTA